MPTGRVGQPGTGSLTKTKQNDYPTMTEKNDGGTSPPNHLNLNDLPGACGPECAPRVGLLFPVGSGEPTGFEGGVHLVWGEKTGVLAPEAANDLGQRLIGAAAIARAGARLGQNALDKGLGGNLAASLLTMFLGGTIKDEGGDGDTE